MVRRILVAATVLVLTSMAVTGCGSTPPKAPASTTLTTATSPSISASPTAATYQLLNKAELTSALLGLDAVPPGYTKDPPDNSPETPVCGKTSIPAHKIDVEHGFTKGGGLTVSLLQVGIRQYDSPAIARQEFNDLVSRLTACKHDKDKDGTTYTYAQMSTPHIGDATFGVSAGISGGGLDVTVAENFALVGPVLIRVGAGGTMSTDTDSATRLFEQQVNKYVAATTNS